MNADMLVFCGSLESISDTSQLENYRPPSFPPPPEFYVSVDWEGSPLSKYSDNYWDFSAYGRVRFNFEKQRLSPENNELLKQLVFLYLYHVPIFPGTVKSVRSVFGWLCKLCVFADERSITIDQLYRYPRLAKQVMAVFTPATHKNLIGALSALLRSERVLGWKVADAEFIARLAAIQVPHIKTQHAYIPPRIWANLIHTTEQVMESFEQHEAALCDAWTWIAEAYRHNISQGVRARGPFGNTGSAKPHGNRVRRVYHGGASAFLEDRGLSELLNRWVGSVPDGKKEIHSLTKYMNLVRDSAFTYLLAHSIQRQGEGVELRADCFITDEDPVLGKVGMLIGETTKTDPDSDARWVVPMRVERAVKIMATIARLRCSNSRCRIPQDIVENPLLHTSVTEPWNRMSAEYDGGRRVDWNMRGFIESNPLAFNEADFRISEDDYRRAYQLTPQLKNKEWFRVGGIWSFCAHQLRRTLAVNLFASDVDDSVVQWSMKHKSLNQSYYYGRNYTRVKVNRIAGDLVTVESYRAIARKLNDVVENSLGDCVHATGKNLIDTRTLKLIEQKEHKKLEALASKGELAARPTLLGFCMTQSCEYGGVESAVHCAGVDGKGPCKDAIFSRKNRPKLAHLYKSNAEQLESLVENTPRHSKLRAENEAIEVYFHATSTDN